MAADHQTNILGETVHNVEQSGPRVWITSHDQTLGSAAESGVTHHITLRWTERIHSIISTLQRYWGLRRQPLKRKAYYIKGKTPKICKVCYLKFLIWSSTPLRRKVWVRAWWYVKAWVEEPQLTSENHQRTQLRRTRHCTTVETLEVISYILHTELNSGGRLCQDFIKLKRF